MVRPYYKVTQLDDKWVIVIAKGKKAGTVIKSFNTSDEAWACYNNLHNADVEL